MSIHIGQLIEEHFDASGLTLSAFAEKCYLQRQNVRKSVFSKTSIDTDILLRISKVLNHNFFNYYLNTLPGVSKNYSTVNEENINYSKTEKRGKVTVSFEVDDPDIKNSILNLIMKS